MNKIIVNATSLRASGALTILNEFIDAIPNDEFEYIIFVDSSICFKQSKFNLEIVNVSAMSFYKRFVWDAYGLKNWLKRNGVSPVAAISLQNTNFRLEESCPNFIYYHQPIPLFHFKWNILKSDERALWFYKNIYPFFVKLFINSKTQIFVQLDFIKEAFIRRYNFPSNKIHVVFPQNEIPIFDENYDILIQQNKVNFFYPATAIFYKNHNLLLKSVSLIDKLLTRKIVIYLTILEADVNLPKDLINVEFVFLGKVSYKEVLWMFKNVDVLLFPSYIETLGLPLIEAAYFGLPIIASNLPYANEVLEGYSGVTYVDYNDPLAWGLEIQKIASDKRTRFESFKKQNVKSWPELFRLVKGEIQNV